MSSCSIPRSFFVIVTAVFVTSLVLPASAVSVFPTDKSDAELDNAFSVQWGPGSFGASTDTDADPANNSGVIFVVNGVTDSGTGIGDNWPLSSYAGGYDPDPITPPNGHLTSNLQGYDSYQLFIENLDTVTLSFVLYMNTGLTGPSGTPASTWQNDTYWESLSWTEIGPGANAYLLLDFDLARPAGIEDNPSPHTQGTNGSPTSINSWDRAEVSQIGFQVALPETGQRNVTFRVSAVPEPVSMVMLGGLGVGMIAARRMRRKK